MLSLSLLTLAGLAAGTFTISDPSDVILPSDWAADDALLSDYNVEFVSGSISLRFQSSHLFQDFSARYCQCCTEHVQRRERDRESSDLLCR